MTSSHDDPRRRFERLFQAHYSAVLAYALRRADQAVAHDVAADTFAVAWRRLDDVPDDPLPWLYAVARRVLANEHRGARRRAALVDRLRVDQAHADPPAGEPAGRLRAALAGLPDRDREALMLTAWEGLSTAQAARTVGCTPTAMRVRLHRARRRLARALADPEPAAAAPLSSPTPAQELLT